LVAIGGKADIAFWSPEVREHLARANKLLTENNKALSKSRLSCADTGGSKSHWCVSVQL